jgi:hypothetical protein
LSRQDKDLAAINSISAPQFQPFDTLSIEATSDPQVADLRASLTAGTAKPGWTKIDGLLLFQGKVFVPDASSVWPLILAATNDYGHEGIEKTLHLWRASFYSPHALRQVREFVQACSTCQRNKSEHLQPADLLQPLQVPLEVWSDISMDFVDGFPKVGGKTVAIHIQQCQWLRRSAKGLCAFMVFHMDSRRW